MDSNNSSKYCTLNLTKQFQFYDSLPHCTLYLFNKCLKVKSRTGVVTEGGVWQREDKLERTFCHFKYWICSLMTLNDRKNRNMQVSVLYYLIIAIRKTVRGECIPDIQGVPERMRQVCKPPKSAILMIHPWNFQVIIPTLSDFVYYQKPR